MTMWKKWLAVVWLGLMAGAAGAAPCGRSCPAKCGKACSATCCKAGAAENCRVEPMTGELAGQLGIDPDFYKKHTRMQGIEIVSSDHVSDYAHKETAFLIGKMTEHLPADMAKRLREAGVVCILIAHDELASDVPEFHTDATGEKLDFYNWRTRGMNTWRNGRCYVVCGEEDVMEYEGGMRAESIFIHEFGHTIMGVGMDKAMKQRVRETFEEARRKGLWNDARAAQRFRRVKSTTPVRLLNALVKAFPDFSKKFFRKCFQGGSILVNGQKAKARVKVTRDDKVLIVFGGPKRGYAGKNPNEYWAEGVQSWFDTNRINDHDHNQIDTREELKAYDPGLAKICEEVFTNQCWRFVSPRKRIGQGHLKGYDPAEAPKFVEPEALKEAANDYYDNYWKPYWDRLRKKYGD